MDNFIKDMIFTIYNGKKTNFCSQDERKDLIEQFWKPTASYPDDTIIELCHLDTETDKKCYAAISLWLSNLSTESKLAAILHNYNVYYDFVKDTVACKLASGGKTLHTTYIPLENIVHATRDIKITDMEVSRRNAFNGLIGTQFMPSTNTKLMIIIDHFIRNQNYYASIFDIINKLDKYDGDPLDTAVARALDYQFSFNRELFLSEGKYKQALKEVAAFSTYKHLRLQVAYTYCSLHFGIELIGKEELADIAVVEDYFK